MQCCGNLTPTSTLGSSHVYLVLSLKLSVDFGQEVVGHGCIHFAKF
jgi:hypothetical protein